MLFIGTWITYLLPNVLLVDKTTITNLFGVLKPFRLHFLSTTGKECGHYIGIFFKIFTLEIVCIFVGNSREIHFSYYLQFPYYMGIVWK